MNLQSSSHCCLVLSLHLAAVKALLASHHIGCGLAVVYAAPYCIPTSSLPFSTVFSLTFHLYKVSSRFNTQAKYHRL